jgi:integrase
MLPVDGAGSWLETNFVLTNVIGNCIAPDNLRNRSFRPLLLQAGLPIIRFHDLRHTSATLRLSIGTNPKVVPELLGHSRISVTMDVYAHVLPTMQQDAMDDLDDLLSA